MNTTILRHLAGALIGGAALTVGGFAVASAGSGDFATPLPCFDEWGEQVPCLPTGEVNPAIPTLPPVLVPIPPCGDLDAGQDPCPSGDGDADADADADGGDGDADGGDGDADGGDGDADGGDGDADGTPVDTDPDPDECRLDEVCERTPTFTG